MKRQSSQDWLAMIEIYSPEHFPILKRSSKEVLGLMQHENPSVRAAATVAGYAIWQWRDHAQFIAKCCDIVTNDLHESPRSAAVAVLHAVFIGSNNSRIQQALACVVKDESAPSMMRNDAYRAIRAIRQKSCEEVDYPRFKEDIIMTMSNKPVQLMDINWQFINQLCCK